MDRKIKQQKRIRRHKRVRAKISGTSRVPRLFVFRSNKYIYAVLINDDKGKTVLSVNDIKLKPKKSDKTRKVGAAYEVGQLIAKQAIENKIKKVVFDRGGYKYHGRVKAVAEGARKAGLKF